MPVMEPLFGEIYFSRESAENGEKLAGPQQELLFMGSRNERGVQNGIEDDDPFRPEGGDLFGDEVPQQEIEVYDEVVGLGNFVTFQVFDTEFDPQLFPLHPFRGLFQPGFRDVEAGYVKALF